MLLYQEEGPEGAVLSNRSVVLCLCGTVSVSHPGLKLNGFSAEITGKCKVLRMEARVAQILGTCSTH